MVLTKPELIASLQNEVRILLHLASKIDRGKLDYRPTPRQRSLLELMQYLTMMGPTMVEMILGHTDMAAWTKAEEAARSRDFDQALAAIAAQPDVYAKLLANVPDATFREEADMFGRKATRGFFLVNIALCSCAAYRTQLFLYLKATGRDELNTYNLWAGMDAPTPATQQA